MKKFFFTGFVALCFGVGFAQDDIQDSQQSLDSTEETQNTTEIQNTVNEAPVNQQQTPIYYIQQPTQQAPMYYQGVDANGNTVYYQVQTAQPIYQVVPAPQPAQQNVYYANSNKTNSTMTPQEQRFRIQQMKKEEKEKKRNSPNHSGFYIEGGLGLHYTSITTIEDYSSDAEKKEKQSGLGPFFNLRIGANIRGHVYLYNTLNISYLSADIKKTTRYYNSDYYDHYSSYRNYSRYYDESETENGETIRFSDGVGFSIIPITNPENPLNNTFFAYSIGFNLYGDCFDYESFMMDFEIGKIWYLTNRFGIGLSAHFSFDFAADDGSNDYSDDNNFDASGRTFGFNVKFVKR